MTDLNELRFDQLDQLNLLTRLARAHRRHSEIVPKSKSIDEMIGLGILEKVSEWGNRVTVALVDNDEHREIVGALRDVMESVEETWCALEILGTYADRNR